MEHLHSSRLVRWMSLPTPGVDLVGWPWQRAAGLAQLGPIFGVLLLLCAALWGIGEYAGYKADLRRAETGRYLAQFREPPVADAWERLSAVWRAEEKRQTILLERMSGISGSQLESASRNYRNFVLDTVEDYRLESEIETVRGFFERLAVCIRVGNCEPTVAQAQVGPALWRFRDQHYDYFALEGVAAEIDRLVTMIAPQEPRRAPGPLALN